MKIRKAEIKDLTQLSILFDEYRIFYEKASNIIGARDFLLERMEKQESVIFVSETENADLVGFTQLYPLFSSTQMRKLWLLNDLYVSPSQRGKGISVVLIDAAKDLCRTTNACGLMLETAKTNFIGNQLYPKTGFALDKEHYYYYWSV